MPRTKAPLTDIACRTTKLSEDGKPRKHFDGGGLYLHVMANGSKLWRLKYRFGGKEKLLALGAYPEVSLASARDARRQARQILISGRDPLAQKHAMRDATVADASNSLESVSREWHAKQALGWALTHSSKVLLRLEKNVFPWLGRAPISEVTAPMILTALRRVEDRGALDTARRLRQYLSQILRYAIQTSRAQHNVAADC